MHGELKGAGFSEGGSRREEDGGKREFFYTAAGLGKVGKGGSREGELSMQGAEKEVIKERRGGGNVVMVMTVVSTPREGGIFTAPAKER